MGNPVAVILDATGLNTDDMQRITRWTNLSETTFTGHPILGTAHAFDMLLELADNEKP